MGRYAFDGYSSKSFKEDEQKLKFGLLILMCNLFIDVINQEMGRAATNAQISTRAHGHSVRCVSEYDQFRSYSVYRDNNQNIMRS